MRYRMFVAALICMGLNLDVVVAVSASGSDGAGSESTSGWVSANELVCDTPMSWPTDL